MNIQINQCMVLISALLCSGLTLAKQKFTDEVTWKKVNAEEYFNQRVSCQSQLEHFYANLRAAPESAGQSKSSHMIKFTNQDIHDKVTSSLKMEQVLSDVYGIEIDNTLLQNDLDRMVRNSQDINKLTALFNLFDNNPNTVAECVSRPYLVKSLLMKKHQNYSQDNLLIKQAAKNSLVQDGKYKTDQDIIAHSFQHSYILKSEASAVLNDRPHVTVLSAAEFEDKINSLKQLMNVSEQPLQENSLHYFTEKLVVVKADSLKVEVVTWDKISFDDWWQSVVPAVQNVERVGMASSLRLPDSTQRIEFKSLNQDQQMGEWQTFIPSPRQGHSAIWTGNEMIVWGGFGSESDPVFYNDGFKYNPITDNWHPINIENAPKGRVNHTAVWTGTEMVIWGGNDFTDYFQDGKRYNPVEDTWISLNNLNAPNPRSYHQAFWTGRYMIVWGGFASNTEPDNGHMYDFNSHRWSAITDKNAPSPRIFSSAVWSGTELIVWGGKYGSNSYDTGARYNVATAQWKPISQDNAPAARYRHLAVWTGDKMLVWGSASSATGHRYGGIYNPLTDSWEIMSIDKQPKTSSYHTLIWTGSEMITWGGFNGSTRQNEGGVYDPETDTWRKTRFNGAPIGRSSHTAVWTGSEMIVWGGGILNTGGRYNPITNSWVLTNETSGRPTGRSLNSTVWTGAEMIVWGGYIYSGATNTGGMYNPITDQWTATASSNAPVPRFLHTAIWTGEEMIVWGGGTYEDPLNSGSRYNPATNQWTDISVDAAPDARLNHSSIWTGNEMIVWGGRIANKNVNTGGKYNPSTDTWVPTTNFKAPSGRRYHTATWTGELMIVWGGENNDDYATNENSWYQPSTDSWQEIDNLETMPFYTAKHSAVWTGDRLITWGGSMKLTSQTGFVYNPVDNSVQTITAPNFLGPRESHSAVWTGTEMIIWGGKGETVPYQFSQLRDGGKYNPATNSWTPTTLVAAPSARANHTAIWTGNSMLFWGSGALGMYYPNGKPVYAIDKQVSGNWYNTEQSGHGLQLELIERSNNTPAILAAWYAYVAGEPMWLIGVGEIENNRVEIDMNITKGTGFPVSDFLAEDVNTNPWGQVTLTFESNNKAQLDWSSDLVGYSAGSLNVERLTQIAADNPDSSGIRSCHSGSWYNPDQSGHGFMVNVIEVAANQHLLMTWYTYLNGQQYWLLASGPIDGNSATLSAITGSGVEFPPNFDPADLLLSDWGSLTFTKIDDNNAVVSWESVLPGFPAGELDVVRLSQLSGYACQ